MMKRNKVVEIETWQHPKYKGEKAVIRLDRNTGEFSAHYGERDITSKDLQEVRDQLFEMVTETMQLEWIPVLTVCVKIQCTATRKVRIGRHATETQEEKRERKKEEIESKLGLHVRRFWLAKIKIGWLQCHVWHSVDTEYVPPKPGDLHDFDAPLPRRANAHEWMPPRSNDGRDFALPYTEKTREHYRDDAELHYLPYTEALWNGLNEIGARMNELGQKLENLIKQDGGIQKIESFCQKALPALVEQVTGNKRQGGESS
jgi:hypothetical protein